VTLGRRVRVANSGTAFLNPESRRICPQQVLVVSVATEAENVAVDLAKPIDRSAHRNRATGIAAASKPPLHHARRCADAIEGLPRIQAVLRIKSDCRRIERKGDKRSICRLQPLRMVQGFLEEFPADSPCLLPRLYEELRQVPEVGESPAEAEADDRLVVFRNP